MRRHPDDVDALRLLGHVDLRRSRGEEAAKSLRRALALVPDHAETLNALGVAWLHVAPAAADIVCRRALSVDSGSADALYNRATLAAARGDEALRRVLLQDAVGRRPDHVSAWNGLGATFQLAGDQAGADRAWRIATTLDPARAEVLANIGGQLWKTRLPEAAAIAAGRVLALDPHSVTGLTARALAYRDLDRHDEALVDSRRALALAPSDVVVLCNLGICLMSDVRPREAAGVQSRALAVDPEHAEARWNRGIARLQSGNDGNGWRDYAWRWRMPGFTSPARGFRQPRWSGSLRPGQTILLHAEQGLGDTLQFLRYAPLIKAAGARIVLEVQPELRRLLDGWPSVDRLVTRGDPIPTFDSHAALMDLPEVLGTAPVTGPGCTPYLGTSAAFDHPLLGTRDLRVGLVWAGGTAHRNDRRRSLPSPVAEHLADRLVDLPGVRLFTLQLGRPMLEGRARAEAIDLSDRLTDMAATAAALSRLDLLVTVDTAIAHLSGALARPTFVLLARDADFRWMLDREDSPWYPTLRLFRQASAGSWTDVAERVVVAVEALTRTARE
ncbi:MAG: glycosyltransferase family protein [Rhodospirillaceae bacterium]|nr:glycosyltransferase family protein [Rhodospirillaceae bacterium]